MTPEERAYLGATRVARLATTADDRPHAVPICFALLEGDIVTPLDEKTQDVDPRELRRVRDIEANPRVAIVADHYTEDWDRLGWVQVRGRAAVLAPGVDGHRGAVGALREKYEQYREQAIDTRPLVRIEPGHTVSWGSLDPALA